MNRQEKIRASFEEIRTAAKAVETVEESEDRIPEAPAELLERARHRDPAVRRIARQELIRFHSNY